MTRLIPLVFLLTCQPALRADEFPQSLQLQSGMISPGLPLHEGGERLFYSVGLSAELNKSGEGKGKLELNPNKPGFTEFGYMTSGGDKPWLKLDCTVKLIKKSKIKVLQGRRVAAEEVEEEWALFEIRGAKLSNRLSLALRVGEKYPGGRILVHDEKGAVIEAVSVGTQGPPEPCHPGCFPAGTRITVGSTTKAIETIRVGETITTVSKEGLVGEGKVSAIFVTKNRLVEVQTEKGTLVTTVTQPLSLASGAWGELRAAGEIQPGDKINWRIAGIQMGVKVKAVEMTSRYESVYNLVLGEPTLFIANGYLVRSKPPAEVEAGK